MDVQVKKLFLLTSVFFIFLSSCSKQPEENVPKYVENMFYYNNLSYEEQILYDELKNAVEKCSSSVKIKNSYTNESFNNIIYSLMYDNPQYFYVNFSNVKYVYEANKIKIEISYHYSKKQIKTMTADFYAAVQAISEKLKLEDGETANAEMEKQIKIHDYIIKEYRLEYTASDSDNIFTALENKTTNPYTASCLFKILMDKAGMECALVRGTVRSSGMDVESEHIWNFVKTDGNYYFTDIVFNFFQDDFMPGMVFHAYFNLNYEKISRDHNFDRPYLFENFSDSYTYYDYKKLYAKDEKSLFNILYSQIRSRIEKRVEFFEIYSELDDNEFDAAILNVIDRINSESGNILKRQYRQFNESNVINAKCVQIFYNDNK